MSVLGKGVLGFFCAWVMKEARCLLDTRIYSTDPGPVYHVSCSATKSAPDEGAFGIGAHSDYGMLTFLLTDGVPGLQVCCLPWSWLPALRYAALPLPPTPLFQLLP